MGIDVNDLKVLINSGFRYLIKSCRQWTKDHPLVAFVLTFFYLLYIFFPILFSILFYTFPLVICVAILFEGPRIASDKHNRDIRHSKKDSYQSSPSNVTKTTTKTTTSYCRHRPYLKSQMSRRTFGKDKNFIEDVVKRKIQPREENRDHEDDVKTVTKKYCGVEPESPVVSVVETTTVTSVDDLPGKCALKSMEDSKTSASRSDIESQDESEDDDEEQKEETNKVIQWTENDQRNLIDLGLSEIERNKRLQSLIAKRWAKKMLSMQPRRDHIDYSREFSASDRQHLESLGSIMVEKQIENGEKQPVSARLRWMPESNPFDIPYDPHEERPVLTRGSFDEEFFDRVIEHNDFSSSVNNGETTPFGLDNHSLPSFFTKKAINDKLGSSCFTRDSDVEEAIADNEGKTSLHVRSHDQALSDLSMVESHKLEIYTSSQNSEHKTDLIRSTKSKSDDESGVVQSVGVNDKNESQLTQDQPSVEHNDDSEVSSSSSSSETNMDVTKTEAFRNSVKKVLTCLVKGKGPAGKEKNSGSTSDVLYDSSPTTTMANKIEISYYTSKTRVTSTQSIASDMQVEVSDTESPKSPPCDPNSPTDRESLVYDGDVERDVNSGDEDLWGVTPHVTRLGDSGNNRLEIATVDNASDHSNVLRIEEEVEQLSGRGEPSSLSPRSILPEDNMNDLMDQKSTNGDIVQSRSSSARLDSQMQNKSVNVAKYLANLPRSESSSNVLEDPWQSHVRGTSQEEITLQDENNHVLEMDEGAEDSKERKELEASKESSEQTSGKSQSETPKESSSASNEQHELKKEHVDQVPNTIEDNQHSEVESTLLEKDISETSSGLRESENKEKEVILDKYSTHHSEEDIANSSRSAQVSDESKPGVTSTNQIEGEVKVKPPNNSVIHDPWKTHVRGTSQEEITVEDENNHVLEMDEDKGHTKERKELEASEENSDQTSGKSQSEAPKDASVASKEQYALHNEHVDEVPNIIEDNQQSEVESIPSEKDVTETSSGLRESEHNEKEVIFDSYSTHGGDDLANSSRSAEASSESEPGVTSKNLVEGEFKVEPPNNYAIHEASTSTDTAEASQHGKDQQKVDTNNEDTINLYEG